MTQGDRLAALLKLSPHTYGDMLAYRISTSPHRRLLEWAAINEWWRIDRKKRATDGLVEWSVRLATPEELETQA